MRKEDYINCSNIQSAFALLEMSAAQRVALISAARDKINLNKDRVYLRPEGDRSPKNKALSDVITQCVDNGITIVTIFDELYSDSLRAIYDPPPILFCRGNVELLKHTRLVAIVGSRRGDIEGINVALSFGEELARENFVIVSGLALGIDSAAHAGALNSKIKGSTVAILGNGLPEISPPSNRRLAQRIIDEGGLIVSQFLPFIPGYKQNFLDRNRVISGLSKGVVVIQATERSGSLVTARYGLEQGREVMVVPGSIKNLRYAGSNHLIREGGTLVRSSSDIMEALGVMPDDGNSHLNPFKNNSYVKVIRARERLSVGELKELVGSPPHFHSELLELEMAGVVVMLPGNFVTLA